MARPSIHATRTVNSVTDTQQQMVLAQPVAALAPNPKHRFWAFPLAGLALVTLACILLSSVFTASRFTTIKRPYAIVFRPPAGSSTIAKAPYRRWLGAMNDDLYAVAVK